MELGTAGTVSDSDIGYADHDDRVVEQRLGELLKRNADIAHEKSLYRTQGERIDSSLMTSPIDSRKAYSYFGLMIGSLPPLAMLFNWIGGLARVDGLFVLLLLTTVAAGATGAVGYSTGRYIPAAVKYASRFGFPNHLLFLSMFGFAWGAISGAIGGLFLFVIGAVPGSIVGGVVGATVLPVLATLHSLMRRGDLIEMKHFLPISFGITLTLCAFILGL
jgi:hypothetical protein